jgi:RimJ/RimL family protein N-acetyltransferase
VSEPETECPAALQVSLAPVTDVDLEAFFEHGREPDGRWLAAFTASDPNDRAAFDWHWRRIRSDPSVEVRTILWNGRVAGHILRYESKFKQHEVSYWIGSAFWGHGIATAALKEFLRTFALMRPLYARVAADNLGSLRVLEACGFRTYAEETSFANARQDDILEYLLRLDRYEAVPFDSEAARSLTLAAHDVYWKLRSTLRLYAGQLKSPEIETLAQEMDLVPGSLASRNPALLPEFLAPCPERVSLREAYTIAAGFVERALVRPRPFTGAARIVAELRAASRDPSSAPAYLRLWAD